VRAAVPYDRPAASGVAPAEGSNWRDARARAAHGDGVLRRL